MLDRVFATAGDWAVGADELQWILYRRRTRRSGPYWMPVSFIRSTRDILARCMREKGTDESTAAQLLSGLSETFDQWKTNQSSVPVRAFAVPVEHGARRDRDNRPEPPDSLPPENDRDSAKKDQQNQWPNHASAKTARSAGNTSMGPTGPGGAFMGPSAVPGMTGPPG